MAGSMDETFSRILYTSRVITVDLVAKEYVRNGGFSGDSSGYILGSLNHIARLR